jgi:hypothetical protein
MKRSSLATGAAFLFPLLLLGGCAQLFEYNLFRSLDPVALPTEEQLSAMSDGEILDYLELEMGSAAFVEKLVGDESVFAAVDGALYDTMNDPAAESENRKRSAVLYADLHLAASGAAEAVNNASQLLSQDPGSLDFADEAAVVDFLQEMIPQIIPAEALASEAAFNVLLDGFQRAWGGYFVFSAELAADPAVPDGVNLGDVTQKALFSYLVAEVLNDGSLYATEAEARGALWDIVNNREPAAPEPAGTFEDPFVPGTALQNILDAAGVSC